MQVEPDIAEVCGGSEDPVSLGSFSPASASGGGHQRAGLRTVCPGTTWPPQGLTPVQASTYDWKGFEPVGWRGICFSLLSSVPSPKLYMWIWRWQIRRSPGTFQSPDE